MTWQTWTLVTAYCLVGSTASGVPAGLGAIAAPATIPFGTSVTMPGYVGAVKDRGGSIGVGRLDVWLPCPQAWIWGARRLLVTYATSTVYGQPWEVPTLSLPGEAQEGMQDAAQEALGELSEESDGTGEASAEGL